MFRVIEGGLTETKSVAQSKNASIAAEGERRLREAGVGRFLAREKLTGIAMPSPMRAFMLQVEFTMEALSRLSPIPMNITEDGYWPTYDRAAPFGAALTKR